MEQNEISLTFIKNDEPIFQKDLFGNLTDLCIKTELLDYNTVIDIENQKFIRENEDFLFTLDINNQTCSIKLKNENCIIPILVEHCLFQVTSDKIELEYVIESEDAKNKIIITKKGDIYE